MNDAKKVYIATQGCQMNVYDSQKMGEVLGASHGMVVTDNIDEADVLLMNTCSIREKAQEKVFSELGRWRKLKEKNPDLVIGVGGCVASQEGVGIQKRAPFVDIVFGPQTLHRLPELYDNLRNASLPPTIDASKPQILQKDSKKIGVVDVSFPAIEKFDHLPEPKVDGVKAFVSIMEGCSKYCSFCIVPYTRGEEFSRPLDDVLYEIATLAEQGVKEITLLGQNVNGYRGETADGGICGFATLLHYVHAIDGIERIRYTTSHPLEFGDDLVQAHATLPKLARHLHLPVQSGSNAILAAMKRNHSIDIYIDKIQKLYEACPDLHLSGDFIIGFPDETAQDFLDTLNLAKQLDFDHSYSFIYSKRPGTPASSLDDNVDLATKKERLATFQDFIKAQTFAKTSAMVGTRQRVLIEAIADRDADCYMGSADNTRTVLIPKSDLGDNAIGAMVMADITEAVSMHMVRARVYK